MAKLAIQTIYERYKQDVYGYLLSLTHDKPLSEDLTSEVFLGAIKTLPAFQGKSDVKTWLFSIARYKWYGHIRRSKRAPTAEDLMEAYLFDHRNPEIQAMSKELIDRTRELLGLESLRNRDIVLMRIEGYSFYEIAQKHHISESSARVLDFRTKGKIRDILQKEGYTYESDWL